MNSNSKPSFILPIATADNLIAKAKSEEYKSILRMVPDNEDQATQIKSFIAKNTKNQNIAILVDEDNPTYSNNLSTNISAKVRNNGGHILLQKKYGNSDRLVNNINDLKNNQILPEMIVFVGVSSNGLLLIDEMLSLDLNIPIIFTDGCTVEELINKSLKLKSQAYFLSAVTVADASKPTYNPIGKDAYVLANSIIQSINDNITRETVSKYIIDKKQQII